MFLSLGLDSKIDEVWNIGGLKIKATQVLMLQAKFHNEPENLEKRSPKQKRGPCEAKPKVK